MAKKKKKGGKGVKKKGYCQYINATLWVLMPEEQNREAVPSESNQSNDLDVKALLARVSDLENQVDLTNTKNKELLEEKRKFKDVEQTLSNLPKGTDINELLTFKQKSEQAELERQGKYNEALTAREEQFREREAKQKEAIQELESKVKNLELINPAVQALSEVVKDPDLVLNNFLPKEKIEMKDGVPVVIDGYDRPPVTEWIKNKLVEDKRDYLLKDPSPQGSGAPSSRSSASGNAAGIDSDLMKRLANGEHDVEHDIYKRYGRDAWLKAKDIISANK